MAPSVMAAGVASICQQFLGVEGMGPVPGPEGVVKKVRAEACLISNNILLVILTRNSSARQCLCLWHLEESHAYGAFPVALQMTVNSWC